MALQLPLIHLNGTSKERLLEAIEEAHEAVCNAMGKLAETYPNGRDYYPLGRPALDKATSEHANRMRSLRTVKDQLEEMALGIDLGGHKS